MVASTRYRGLHFYLLIFRARREPSTLGQQRGEERDRESVKARLDFKEARVTKPSSPGSRNYSQM